MGQRWLTMPSSTMETKWKTDPKAKAPSATRNRCSRRRTNVRMACRRPSEYSPAATRSQMTLISAMGRCDTPSLPNSISLACVFLAPCRVYPSAVMIYQATHFEDVPVAEPDERSEEHTSELQSL